MKEVLRFLKARKFSHESVELWQSRLKCPVQLSYSLSCLHEKNTSHKWKGIIVWILFLISIPLVFLFSPLVLAVTVFCCIYDWFWWKKNNELKDCVREANHYLDDLEMIAQELSDLYKYDALKVSAMNVLDSIGSTVGDNKVISEIQKLLEYRAGCNFIAYKLENYRLDHSLSNCNSCLFHAAYRLGFIDAPRQVNHAYGEDVDRNELMSQFMKKIQDLVVPKTETDMTPSR